MSFQDTSSRILEIEDGNAGSVEPTAGTNTASNDVGTGRRPSITHTGSQAQVITRRSSSRSADTTGLVIQDALRILGGEVLREVLEDNSSNLATTVFTFKQREYGLDKPANMGKKSDAARRPDLCSVTEKTGNFTYDFQLGLFELFKAISLLT